MTTARYFTPDGRSIQATGIKPDIEVRPAELKELDSRPFFTEADLSGHLEGENEEEARKAREQAAEAQASAADRDYQLRSALNLLKGLHILNRKNNSKPQENAQ